MSDSNVLTEAGAVDVAVVGGGHAGIEAAVAAARMGCSVSLVTADRAAIGRMSCNPAIGGTAKGHLVHEIDALGGVMGQLADATGIQFRMLNRSKGPAVWSSRCQSDSAAYAAAVVELIDAEPRVRVVEADVVGFDPAAPPDGGGVMRLASGASIGCGRLIVASGTFLNGMLHTGTDAQAGGRAGERAASGLSASFATMGIHTGRLKTGTPPRLRARSVAFDDLERQVGDADPVPFSRHTDRSSFPALPQIVCHITHTNLRTHAELARGFDRSPMFTGRIQGAGPRYCPSIEDKLVRFPDRERHQLFLEPEGLESDLIYVNGFSSSLPAEIQEVALRTVPGLADAEIVRYGYAVEYDYFPAHQLDLTLESKHLAGVFFAGQVNGTSGYEEAAAQGLLAGINAAASLRGEPELVLRRDEAYIGVLIDDLVTKPSDEPYRIFTSRAEHRLALRQDNAARRLTHYGVQLGLVSKERGREVRNEQVAIDRLLGELEGSRVQPQRVNAWMSERGAAALRAPETLAGLARRPDVGLENLVSAAWLPTAARVLLDECPPSLRAATAIELKYAGYVAREREAVARSRRLESMRIPRELDFGGIQAMSHEARERLTQVRPRTLGQASRVSGVSAADLSILMVWLRGRG